MVTRPEHQAEALAALLAGEGARVFRFPVIAIEPAAVDDTRALAGLPEYTLCIFISANAVRFGLPFLKRAGGPWSGQRLAAVGRATARALTEAGMPAPIHPDETFTSEALLAMDELGPASVAGRHVLIVRGQGGRELLADALRERGAKVDYLEVYRRVVPKQRPETLMRALRDGRMDIITITSGEGLENLVGMLGDNGGDTLRATPLLVVSQAIAQRARALGWHGDVLVSPRADDRTVVEVLGRWWEARR